MKAITEITSSQQTANVIRLAPYCRVSSDSEDQLHSFAAQIQYYTEYAQRNPQYRLVDIYADEGITGTSMEKRDDFHRLMRDCKKGLIDRIIVKSVSRFARNTEELLATLRMLSEIGVSVYFEENAIDTAMMNSEMIVTFPGMSAQQESISISENMRWSYKKRMESGEFNCCAPAYGFSLVNGQLEINEAEAAVVQRIFPCICMELESRASPICSTQTVYAEIMAGTNGTSLQSTTSSTMNGIWEMPCSKRASPPKACPSKRCGTSVSSRSIMWRTAIPPSSAGKPMRRPRSCKNNGRQEPGKRKAPTH